MNEVAILFLDHHYSVASMLNGRFSVTTATKDQSLHNPCEWIMRSFGPLDCGMQFLQHSKLDLWILSRPGWWQDYESAAHATCGGPHTLLLSYSWNKSLNVLISPNHLLPFLFSPLTHHSPFTPLFLDSVAPFLFFFAILCVIETFFFRDLLIKTFPPPSFPPPLTASFLQSTSYRYCVCVMSYSY